MNMETKERINVAGTMKTLEIGGGVTLNKSEYKASMVRTTASTLKQDTGIEFSVSVSGDKITITRTK